MNWDEWCKTYPAKKADKRPINYHGVFYDRVEAEIFKDKYELFNDTNYEVVQYQSEYFVVYPD